MRDKPDKTLWAQLSGVGQSLAIAKVLLGALPGRTNAFAAGLQKTPELIINQIIDALTPFVLYL